MTGYSNELNGFKMHYYTLTEEKIKAVKQAK